MYRLRGSDAQFIYNSSPTSPFETLKAVIYEPADPSVPLDPKELKDFIYKRTKCARTLGPFSRVMRIPFDLHHPVWVRDPNFNIDDHYHHIALPAPGGKEELCKFISQLLSRPLDPDRPLWETWIVEGLEGGKVASVSKVHHVLADGLNSVQGITNLHTADGESVEPSIHTAKYDKVPTKLRLLWDALVELLKSYTIELPSYYRHIKKVQESSKAIKEAEEKPVAPFSAPYTCLNVPGGPYRVYNFHTFSLAQIKTLSKKLDCTINTLVMGVISEALRRYILEYDHLPDSPLVSVMPVGLRGEGSMKKLFNTDFQNNSVALAMIPLDLSITDFRERLKAIQHGSTVAIENLRKSEGHRLDNFFDFFPGSFVRLLNIFMMWRIRNKKAPAVNIAISNVPGPKEALYACNGKAKVVDLLSCGNLGDIGSTNFTIWSYMDKICFSFLYRKGALENPMDIDAHVKDIVHKLLVEEGID